MFVGAFDQVSDFFVAPPRPSLFRRLCQGLAGLAQRAPEMDATTARDLGFEPAFGRSAGARWVGVGHV